MYWGIGGPILLYFGRGVVVVCVCVWRDQRVRGEGHEFLHFTSRPGPLSPLSDLITQS